jgi:dihydrofolate synthase / folylpolyglutamate synthase
MNYTQCIERLFQKSSRVAMHRDLARMQLLDAGLGYPTESYHTIHVAGSNGKGSVSLKIACALAAEGYQVGLYTSPHLFTFRERIAINGEYISEEDVVEELRELFAWEEKCEIEASFFELTTALAFNYFRRRNVDFAVIETGLGGRLDATNVLRRPVSTVITSISREHVHILGDDLESIAAEKAGIIKEAVPVILGPKAHYQAIYKRAKIMGAPLFLSKKISQFFDEENSAVAELALNHLPFSLSPASVAKGIAVRPSCRFERMHDVIFDAAHNPDAIFHLLQALHTFFPKRHVRFLVGFSADKDYECALRLLSDVATHVHLVQAATPRAASLHALASAMEAIDMVPYSVHETVALGVEQAHKSALEKGELLVITGSFYLMADAKEALGVYPPRDSLDLNEKFSGSFFSSSRT